MANIVQNTSTDSFTLFGQQVADEMRKIKDNMTQTRLKRNIMTMIYDAQESEIYTQPQHAPSYASSKYPPPGYPSTYPTLSQPPAGYLTSQAPRQHSNVAQQGEPLAFSRMLTNLEE